MKIARQPRLYAFFIGVAVFLEFPFAHAETHLSASLGYQSWGALAALTPEAGGRFDSGAPVLSGTAHWRMPHFENSRVLLGADVGYFSHSSDIAGFRTDLSASGFYAASSATIELLSRKAYVELGVGVYRVSLQEEFVLIDGITNAPESPDPEAHEQQEFGVFLGVGISIPAASEADSGWTIGAKIHFPDFGETSGLGGNSGSLSGPILMVQFGYRFAVGS